MRGKYVYQQLPQYNGESIINFNKIKDKYCNEINIKTFLKQYIDREIIYVPNPGNAGDALIVYGTLTVFDEIGLNYIIGAPTKKYKNKLLFYAGGGNLVGIYKNCFKFFMNNKNENEIVLLPHTIKNEDELIMNLGKNIKIICRELTSYKYVYGLILNKENVFLSYDMAFYIKNLNKYKKKGKGTLNCFRTDYEKTKIKIPDDNIDLSRVLSKPNHTYDKNIIKSVSFSIFEYLSKYSTINTNRLHMAIAGSLLNKKVVMYANSYYKNKAVYNYSIKNKFKNTIYKNF